MASGCDGDQYRMVLEEAAGDVLLNRDQRNGHVIDLFFADSAFRRMYVDYLMTTYDEFRAEAGL